MEQAAYQPHASVLEKLKLVTFVAVVGPTAVGKTTLIRAALARHPKLHMVVVTTSRDSRPGEQEGKDYLFRTREQMQERIKQREYVQVAPAVFGDLYATAPEQYATDKVNSMAVLADAVPVFRALPFRQCRTIFVLPPSWEVWRQRLGGHSFMPEQLERRLKEAATSLRFALSDDQTQFVVNASLDTASEDMATLAFGETLPSRLQADQSRARKIVRNLLDNLQYQ